MEYLGICPACRSPIVLRDPDARPRLPQGLIQRLTCTCPTGEARVLEFLHEQDQRWSNSSLQTVVQQVARDFRYTVRHIPSMEKATDRAEGLALTALNWLGALRRLFRKSRYTRILDDDFIGPHQGEPMPTRQEQELLELLAQQRRRNAQAMQPEAPLPDLTPEMLTSAAGRQELQAMRQIATPIQPGVADVITEMMREQVAYEQDTNHGRETYPAREREVMRAVAASEPDLGSLFMNREAQLAAEALGVDPHAHTYAAEHATEFSVDFSDLDDLPGRTQPNEGARWQVGRESPPPIGFARSVNRGPSEGQVVSSRRDDGSWSRPRPAPMPRPNSEVLRATERAAQAVAAPRPSVPLQAAREAARAPQEAPYQGPRPTVYDRILGDDIV